jgi:hypothetical protein
MHDLRFYQALNPLRKIFWGVLLLVLHLNISLTTNGHGYKFDLLNDFIGAILVAIGVFRLADFRVSHAYVSWMKFLKVMAVIGILLGLLDHFVFEMSPAWHFLRTFLQLLNLIALIGFCRCMRWLCEEYGAEIPARSWAFTELLFLLIYLLPVGALYIAVLAALISQSSFNIQLPPAMIIVLFAALIVPLIHFFISTSRMKAAALGDLADHSPE